VVSMHLHTTRNLLGIRIEREKWIELRNYACKDRIPVSRLVIQALRQESKIKASNEFAFTGTAFDSLYATTTTISYAVWALSKKSAIDRNESLTSFTYRALSRYLHDLQKLDKPVEGQ
jgi:hypothetical protein